MHSLCRPPRAAVSVRCAAQPSAGAPYADVKSWLKIVPARLQEAQGSRDHSPGIAAIFAEAFGQQSSSSANSSIESGRAAIEDFFLPPRSEGEWQRQVAAALQAKQAAAQESRRWRMEQIREERRRGGWGRRYTAAERQQFARWRRQRSFVVLVAEDRASGEVLGCAAVSLAQPEAALPPPFPTSKPRRVYVSNIAVLPPHRRQGVATALLLQCERQARLWRMDSLWLHVELTNQPALQLYERLGYKEVGRDPVFTPKRRCLMRKEVEPLQCSSKSSSSSRAVAAGRSGGGPSSGAGSGGGGSSSQGRWGSGRPAGGVFQWGELDLPQPGSGEMTGAAGQAEGAAGQPAESLPRAQPEQEVGGREQEQERERGIPRL